MWDGPSWFWYQNMDWKRFCMRVVFSVTCEFLVLVLVLSAPWHKESPSWMGMWAWSSGGAELQAAGIGGSLSFCQILFDFSLSNREEREREMWLHSLLLSFALSCCCCSDPGNKHLLLTGWSLTGYWQVFNCFLIGYWLFFLLVSCLFIDCSLVFSLSKTKTQQNQKKTDDLWLKIRN